MLYKHIKIGTHFSLQTYQESVYSSNDRNRAVICSPCNVDWLKIFPTIQTCLAVNSVKQGCPNYGPRANCGPRSSFYWPAANSENIIEYGPHKKLELNSVALLSFNTRWSQPRKRCFSTKQNQAKKNFYHKSPEMAALKKCKIASKCRRFQTRWEN